MSIVNIVSAIGNNSSVYPLLVRDCGIENPAKVVLTYNQNAKESRKMAWHAARERFIDEYGSSAIWLGGIPAVEFLANKFIKRKGFNPAINPKLFKEQPNQGLEYNIKNFAQKAPEAVADLVKVKNNKKTYEKLLSSKFVLATAIPALLMGVVLPKLNFKYTAKKMQESNENKSKINYDTLDLSYGKNFVKKSTSKDVNFKGVSSVLSNMTQVQKMAVTDGGLTVGRVATGRTKNEKIEMGFKMVAMMFVNFVTPSYIQKGLDGLSSKLFGTNVTLDPAIIANKKFLTEIKNNTLALPKDNVIEFIDNNPKSTFTELSKKFCKVKFLENSNIRDPRYYVEEEKIKALSNSIKNFANDAKNSGDIKKYASKALKIKSFNILSNIVISSLLLAVGIPKAQFVLRKIISGTDIDPGLLAK